MPNRDIQREEYLKREPVNRRLVIGDAFDAGWKSGVSDREKEIVRKLRARSDQLCDGVLAELANEIERGE